MKVTNKTRYSYFLTQVREDLLADETKNGLTAGALAEYGDPYKLTIRQFIDGTNGDLGGVLGPGWNDSPTVLQFYWLKNFETFCNQFAAALQALQLPQTNAERRAAESLPDCSLYEHLITFARSYFGLPSFAAAELVELGELLVAKKDTYRNELYRRKLDEINRQEMRQKPRKL